MKKNPEVLAGSVGGPPPLCAFCGMDLSGRMHATAIVAHALEECRGRLKKQRDDANVATAFAIRGRRGREGVGSVKHMLLWAHCVSEHSVILEPDIDPAELRDYHASEHAGPGTLRNHDETSREYSLDKIARVLLEAAS